MLKQSARFVLPYLARARGRLALAQGDDAEPQRHLGTAVTTAEEVSTAPVSTAFPFPTSD